MMPFLATTVLALTLATPAFSASEYVKAFGTVDQKGAGDFYASDLIGMRVYATDKDPSKEDDKTASKPDWDDIGESDDIILNEKGRVKAVILGVGGFLGIGERDIAVKMSSLNMVQEADDADDFFIVVNTNKDALMKARAYERDGVSSAESKTDEMQDKKTEAKKTDDEAAAMDSDAKAKN